MFHINVSAEQAKVSSQILTIDFYLLQMPGVLIRETRVLLI